jgi:hypothetical protein
MSLHRRWLLLNLCLGLLLSGPQLIHGDDDADETEEPPPVPFAVVNAGSVERVLTEVQYVFDVAERPELMEMVDGALATIKNLEGMDRTKPFGALLYLDAGLPPTPFPVAYIPVLDEQKLIDTLTFGDNRWKRSGTDPARYDQISEPKMHLKFAHGYAFICRQGDWVLEEELPEPAAFNEVLTSRYDVAASLRIGSVPTGIRQVFVGFLRASSEAELQQRDDEPLAAYRVRRANGLQTLEFIEQLLTEGEQITLGLDASMDARSAVFELNIEAQPNSEFADYLTDVSGTTSLFHALADDTQPLTIAATFKLNERDKKAYREYIDVAREEGLLEIERAEPTIPITAVRNMIDAVDATLIDGQIDILFQFVAPDADRFVILGVAKIVGARAAGAALGELLAAIKEQPDNDATIELNVASHEGISFHRIEGENASASDERMFGGKPSVYVGTSDQAVWFAMGRDPMPELKHAIDLVRESAARAAPVTGGSPMRITARLNRWMQLEPRDRGDRGPGVPRQLAEQAFAFEDDDALRLDMRPTEHGVRMRLSFDEAFLRFLGMAVGRGFDDNQRRQQEARQVREAEEQARQKATEALPPPLEP